MRIVAIGDSVVWGQGLLHQDKFVRIVTDELGADLEMPGDFLAHSGAVIGPADPDGCQGIDPRVTDFTARGELPCEAPAIVDQLADIRDPESVDVLILDGGANDLESGFFMTLVNPLETLPQLERKMGHAFLGVPVLIAKSRARCPNAVIVYTGYYAGVSRETETRAIDKLAFVEFMSSNAVTALALLEARNSIVINNLFFAHDQLHRIRRAVSEAVADPELRGPGILFAHPRFASFNALGARGGDGWVQLVLGAFVDDAQFDVRKVACRTQFGPDADAVLARLEEAAQDGPPANLGPELLSLREEIVGEPFARFECQIAGTFHPTVEGARKGYARAVLRAVQSNQRMSVGDLARELAPTTGSVRGGLHRYGLGGLRDRRGSLSLREASQHLVADVLMVAVQTGHRDGVLGGGEGTDHEIHLDLGPRSWHLTRAAGRSRNRHPLNEFQASDTPHLFTVDPSYAPDGGAGESRPLRLSEITHVRILKVVDQPAVSPDFFLGNVMLTLNERIVIYDASGGSGSSDAIDKKLTRRDPTWTSGEQETPPYPLPA